MTKPDALKTVYPLTSLGCWIRFPSDKYGRYGSIWFKNKRHRIHRLMYESVSGRLPQKIELHHLCLNRFCYNPTHLLPVTSKQHAVIEPKQNYWGKTETCPRGHRLSEVGILFYSRGRHCRECNKTKSQEYYRANRARICALKRKQYHSSVVEERDG